MLLRNSVDNSCECGDGRLQHSENLSDEPFPGRQRREFLAAGFVEEYTVDHTALDLHLLERRGLVARHFGGSGKILAAERYRRGSVQGFVELVVAEFVESEFQKCVLGYGVCDVVLTEFVTEFRILRNADTAVIDKHNGRSGSDHFLDLFDLLHLLFHDRFGCHTYLLL